MPRVADTWTNKDIQNNPQGYLEAQRREREQAAEAEWRRARNERAADSARAREERTRREMYERRMRSV